MTDDQRSGCPINLTLEVVGDKWSLLVIRDMMFGNRRHFRELLTRSEEGIASNILADRLKTLVEHGIVTRTTIRATSRRRSISLTEQGIELLPCSRRCRAGVEISSRQRGTRHPRQLLSEGGPKMWAEFMDELRETHLGVAAQESRGERRRAVAGGV